MTKRLSEIGLKVNSHTSLPVNLGECVTTTMSASSDALGVYLTFEQRRELVREVVRQWCSYEWQLSTINGQIAWIEEFIEEQGL